MLNKERIKNTGFTLIELMIVIGVVAILVALAMPSYQGSVRKARRSDAQAALMTFAGTAERIFTRTSPGSYATATLPADTDFYTYSFTVAPSATAYTIQAAPASAQTADKCGTMTLAHTGQRTHTGSETDCW